jgi:hypothetical protein
VLNREDPGLLSSLDTLSAEQASQIPIGGGVSIAAHVDHLRFGLELLNRWSRGEETFADADFSASWNRITVSAGEWAARREALAREAHAWREALERPREGSSLGLAPIVASVVHLAYHLGAIRQIDRSIRGSSAGD